MRKCRPAKPDDDLDDDEDEVTDEEDPKSQESHVWLESGKPPPKGDASKDGSGPSNYQDKKANLNDPSIKSEARESSENISMCTDGSMHDCQKMMKFYIFQEMHDLTARLNPQVVLAEIVPTPDANANLSLVLEAAKIHEEISFTCLPASAESVVVENISESFSIGEDSMTQQEFHPEDVVAPEAVLPKHVMSSKACCTRPSSRFQDNDMFIQEKAMTRKAGHKSTIPTPSPSIPSSSSALDNIGRVCGFSLCQDESVRVANISLIQAKENVMNALLNTKQKILASSELENGVLNDTERSQDQQAPVLEIYEDSAILKDNLLAKDHG